MRNSIETLIRFYLNSTKTTIPPQFHFSTTISTPLPQHHHHHSNTTTTIPPQHHYHNNTTTTAGVAEQFDARDEGHPETESQQLPCGTVHLLEQVPCTGCVAKLCVVLCAISHITTSSTSSSMIQECGGSSITTLILVLKIQKCLIFSFLFFQNLF